MLVWLRSLIAHFVWIDSSNSRRSTRRHYFCQCKQKRKNTESFPGMSCKIIVCKSGSNVDS